MAIDRVTIDFLSEENKILLNPRWPQDDHAKLTELAEAITQSRKLHGHFWLATSGSTAENILSTKLVAISKRAVLNSAKAVNEHLKVTAEDIWTQVLPQFHVGGLGIEARAFLSGSKVIPALNEGRWDPQHFYKVITENSCTLSALVPAQVFDLVQNNLQAPEKLRAVVVGGGVLSEDLYLKAKALGWMLLPSYGMTETCSQIATAHLDSVHKNEYPQIQLLSHAKARTNEQGLIEVWCSSLFTCYAQIDGNSGNSWDPKVQTWFTTEDLGEVIDKSIKVIGRNSDYVKIGGEATNLLRLRLILEQSINELNPSWLNKLTILDFPSERLGAEIHLVSSLDEASTQSVVNRFAEKVLPFEKARNVHYVKSIPRSDLGKILWGALRRLL